MLTYSAPARRTFEENRRAARTDHDDGSDSGGTISEPRDVPGLGLAAWIQTSTSGPKAETPGTVATLCVLLPGERIVRFGYSGHDGAALDTGDGQDTGTAKPIPTDEVDGAVLAIAKDVVAALG